MDARVNSYSGSDLFWTRVNETKQFALYFAFCKIKFRNNKRKLSKQEKNPFNDSKLNKEYLSHINKRADLTGGFIPLAELKQIAKQVGYTQKTLSVKLRELCRAGLIIKKHTGYVMISMIKAAAMLDVNLKRLKTWNNDRNVLKNKHALNVIKRVIYKKNKVTHGTHCSNAVTLSCKGLSSKLGYKSQMTGCKREKSLELKNQITISRHRPVKGTLVDSAESSWWKRNLWKVPCNKLKLSA